MGTSGGEPKTLLNALKPMLGPSGDIKSPQEVVRVVSLMRDAEKLMSRCVYLNILKSTIIMSHENQQSTETLEKFVSIGGWAVLNKWLSDGKKSENFSIIIELLEILKDLPVSVDTLKQGNIGKIVKYLTKVDNQDVKKMSSAILKQWMSLVRHKSGSNEGQKGTDKSKQNGDSIETGSQASDSSVELMSSTKIEELKALKRQRESEGNTGVPEKKPKHNDAKAKFKKESKVVAIESAGFMNALATASAAPVKKRKRTAVLPQKTTANNAATTTSTTASPSSNNKVGYSGLLDEIMSNQSQTHGFEEKPKSRTVDELSSNSNGTTSAGSPQSALSIGDAGDFSKDSENADKDKTTESNTSTPSTVTVTDDSTDVELTAKKPNKKGLFVTWAEDSKLASYHFFEMDEEERALIRHPVNFVNAAHNEMMNERMLIEKAKRLNDDKMIEKLKWYRPKRLQGINENVEYGANSEEKNIQKERESSVLADIFFSKSSLPDTPAEPDLEHEKQVTGEPKVIPHDEKGTTHPAPKTTPSPATTAQVQLPAALASLFSTAPPVQTPSATSAPPSADPVSVQSLLDKIMSNTGSGQPLNQLLSSVKQQQQQQQQQRQQHQQQEGGLPNALKNILEPMQGKPKPGIGILGLGPGEMGAPGQFGPRGPRGLPFLPDQRPRFQGPGGPRPNVPFPGGPDGPMRGGMPLRIGGPGPRPLLPELANPNEKGEQNPEGLEGEDNGSMRGRGRGMPRGRGIRGRGRGRGGIPICRHFVSQRGCLRGESCHFLHPGINGPPL